MRAVLFILVHVRLVDLGSYCLVMCQQEKQRKEVERKLEVKARQEKEELRKEKQTLFLERKHKQLQLKKLQQKIELVEIVSNCQRKSRFMSLLETTLDQIDSSDLVCKPLKCALGTNLRWKINLVDKELNYEI